MAKEFTLEGEIGWEVDTWSVKNMLREAKGEDITVKFASPGGSVFTGLKIYNLFKNYSGNVDFHLIGEAASMGSYIPLAGNRVTAEPNVVYMIHNARSIISGDHNEMRKRADIIEGLSNLLRNEYVSRTGKTPEEITKMMDDETYLFGQEAVDAGFIDEIMGEADADPDARETHIALATEAFEACMQRVKKEKSDDYEQAAAYMPDVAAHKTPNERENDDKGDERMDINEIKAKYPELCAALRQEGIDGERGRVTAHLIMGEASGDMKTAITAIEDGSEMTPVIQARYWAAGMNRGSLAATQADETVTAEGADGLTPEDTAPAAEAETEAVIDQVFANCGVELVKKGV